MNPQTILLVDDDGLFRETAAELLAEDGLQVRTAADLASARTQLDQAVALLVVDQRLPDGHGLSLVQDLREQGHRARVLIVTAHPEVGDAVEALRLRIDDYLTKPIDLETLRLSVLRSLETVRLEQTQRLMRREQDLERTETLVGDGLAEVRRLVATAAATTGPVLITGETGTGKSLAAKAIHYQGSGDRPFVKTNCAAIPDTLVEAELFGVEKGAFTGAGSSREGLFELASDGTLFLDEIGELSPTVQAKLLGVLEDGRARRVGGGDDRDFSVRVLAATNVDVAAAIERGEFRRDLFYRLNVLRIDLPPLRSRLGDLPDLVPALLRQLSGARDLHLAAGEMSRLQGYSWPGNVRELRNVLERSLLLAGTDKLAPSSFLPANRPSKGLRDVQDSGSLDGAKPDAKAPTAPEDLPTLEEMEMAHIHRMLQACGGNRTHAARHLGIGLATLRRKINRSK